jgi:lysozyme
MHTSDKGLKLIKAAESCHLSAYPDPASPLGKACTKLGLPMSQYTKVPRWQLLKANPVTIGWGHTGPSVKLGDKIDQKTADSLLRMDLKYAETALWGLTLNQNQFDALVSLIYNIGFGNFSRSTLLKCLRAGDYEGAADEFIKWNKAGGHVLNGLTNRRKAERALFLTPEEEEGAA